jgi:uncharacterized protein
MELTLERPGDHLFIRSFGKQGIQVVDEVFARPIILSTQDIISDWAIADISEFGHDDIDRILGLSPEVVLIGTGARQVFLEPGLMMRFYEGQVGVEIMTTEAACRTFNVLASELRNVAAALIP